MSDKSDWGIVCFIFRGIRFQKGGNVFSCILYSYNVCIQINLMELSEYTHSLCSSYSLINLNRVANQNTTVEN